MNVSRIVMLLFMLMISLLIIGCDPHPYFASEHAIASTQEAIANAKQDDRTQPAVVVDPGFYVNSTRVALNKTPNWLRRTVSMRAQRMPFSLLVSRLLRGSNHAVSYDNTVRSNRLVNLNYHGTVKGALDALAAQTNYAYTYNTNEVAWSAFETRTFQISFMPGQSTYLVGQSQNRVNQESYNQGGSASINPMNDQQYSSLEGELSIWHDITRTLEDLQSSEGRIMVSESTTSVTVHDHPQNIRAMGKYIAKLNKSLSQEVAIQVEVLEVDLNNNFNFGVNWDAILKDVLDTNFNLKASLASATNLVNTDLLNSGSSGAAQFIIGSDARNSIIQALNTEGKVRVVTKPEVVTMNNQIAAIRITTNTGYLQSVEQSFAGDNGSVVSTSLIPGTVTNGFTLFILPKILKNKVFMQISSTLSNLINIQKESNNPTTSTDEDNQNQQQYSAIELPTVAEKTFNQRSVVESGSTLIIAGFKQLRDQTASAKLYGLPGAGQGSKSENVETIVMITPIILNRPKQ